MADPTLPRAEWEALAAELALGVLAGEERARALRLTLSDPEFAAEVRQWEARLTGLLDDTAELPAPPSVWSAIEARVAPVPTASVRTLRFWQAGAVGSGAIAAALALALLTQPRDLPPTPAPIVIQPAIVASLSGAPDGPNFATRYDPRAAQLKVRATAAPPTGHRPVLWIIPADGVPRALGTVAASGETQLPVAEGHRALIRDGATLAVTWEPDAAPMPAAPSSAPVAAGRIATL